MSPVDICRSHALNNTACNKLNGNEKVSRYMFQKPPARRRCWLLHRLPHHHTTTVFSNCIEVPTRNPRQYRSHKSCIFFLFMFTVYFWSSSAWNGHTGVQPNHARPSGENPPLSSVHSTQVGAGFSVETHFLVQSLLTLRRNTSTNTHQISRSLHFDTGDANSTYPPLAPPRRAHHPPENALFPLIDPPFALGPYTIQVTLDHHATRNECMTDGSK